MPIGAIKPTTPSSIEMEFSRAMIAEKSAWETTTPQNAATFKTATVLSRHL